jgi:DNA (cytosine-5)-methyltransferase 1
MPKFIDFFAGAGGLSEGFIKAGYIPVAHVEMKKDACNTLKTRAAFHYLREQNQLDIYENYLRNKKEGSDGSALWNQVPANVINRVIQATIGEETMDDITARLDALVGGEPIDIIIGGPPCQAYSIAGRAKMGEDVKKDPRNYLYRYYLRFIEHFHPKMFVFENVMGITTAQTVDMVRPFEDLKRIANDLGYDVEAREQIASDFEVLQHRHRMIIVGWRREDDNNHQTGFHYPELTKIKNKYKTRQDIFADLPERKNGDGKLCELVQYTRPLEEMEYLNKTGIRGLFDFTTQHVTRSNNERDREIYCIAIKEWKHKRRLNYAKLPPRLQTHKNTSSFLNRFSVVDPHGCCHTVVAHIAMDGHYYIFPSKKPTVENARSISVREAARLQSFPDDYFFEGSRTSVFMQIGNAVPVMMSYHIAVALLLQLEHE